VAAVPAASALADAGALSARELTGRRMGAHHPAMPLDWEGFFTLVPERDGEQPERSGTPAASFEEVLWNIGLRDLVLTHPAHYASTYGVPVATARKRPLRRPDRNAPLLIEAPTGRSASGSAVPAPDLAPVPFVVAHRAGPPGALVALFCSVARDVTRELIALIPGAEARVP
jgi:hypothetical protein